MRSTNVWKVFLFSAMLVTVMFFLGVLTGDRSEVGLALAGPPDDNHQEMTVTGAASGFDCAVVNVLCPSTHRAGDYTTGVFTNDNQFYFVVNIPQSFMTQHFLETMEVNGTIYEPYEHAIEPEEIYVLNGDEKTLVYESGYFFDPQGHKAIFNQGRFVDGVWLCDQCARNSQ